MNEIELFTAALAISNPAKRALWLDARCAGDHVLKQRLERLLAAAAASGNPLDDNPRDDPGVTLPTPPPALGPAHRISRRSDRPGRSSPAGTSSCSRSAKGAWAASGWPSRSKPSNARSPSS